MLNKDKVKLGQINYFKGVSEVVATNFSEDKLLFGVKDVKEIPNSLVKRLEGNGFAFHTLDRHSLGGRAIDLNLINPITGAYMTGSSSGTAINVRSGINDLGIGTDGGGSVLAPAISLNLFAFISPLIESEYLKEYKKTSTDGIVFSPSIGFIAKDYQVLNQAINTTIKLDEVDEKEVLAIVDSKEENLKDIPNVSYKKVDFCDHNSSRANLIDFLNANLNDCDFLVFSESKIDLLGFGDSVFGNFDSYCKEIQKKANKGFLRVCNLVNASAISIPKKELASAYLIICQSDKEKISKALKYASKLVVEDNKLLDKYLTNISNYTNHFIKES